MRAAWRPSGLGRPQPRETDGPPPACLRTSASGGVGKTDSALATGSGAGQRFAMRPRAGIVTRAAWRTSGSARQQTQETARPSTRLLQRTRPSVPQSQTVGQ